VRERGLGIVKSDSPGGSRRQDGRKPRVGMLSSYNIPPGKAARESMRVQGFLQALAANGWIEGHDFELILLDIEERPAMHAAARALVEEGVDLLQAFGTPNGVAAAELTSEVPIIYVGAHPEGIGERTLGAPNVTGKVLGLPFTASYKNFRFIRRFLPQVKTVWTVFFEDTVFVQPEMRELHRAARDRAGRRVWLSSLDGPTGFRTLAGLGNIVGVEYRELVFADPEELDRGLQEIDPKTGALMNYNELLHCPGALDVLLARSAEMGIPTIFNNNAQAVALGILAGFAADWAKLGRQSGEIAARILGGAHPRDFPREVHMEQVAWLNLDTARRLGLEFDPEVLGYFDLPITGKVDTLCM
jgi:putative tryptophan/tyrosine transport system substrate-binding protein